MPASMVCSLACADMSDSCDSCVAGGPDSTVIDDDLGETLSEGLLLSLRPRCLRLGHICGALSFAV